MCVCVCVYVLPSSSESVKDKFLFFRQVRVPAWVQEVCPFFRVRFVSECRNSSSRFAALFVAFLRNETGKTQTAIARKRSSAVCKSLHCFHLSAFEFLVILALGVAYSCGFDDTFCARNLGHMNQKRLFWVMLTLFFDPWESSSKMLQRKLIEKREHSQTPKTLPGQEDA